MMNKTVFGMLLIGASFFTACHDEHPPALSLEKTRVPVNGRQLAAYVYDAQSEYVAVFESGLGDGVQPWFDKQVLEQTAEYVSVIGYDRAGYGDSDAAPDPRDIPALRRDLEALLSATFPGKKYLLVGHSYGGLLIRDFAVQHPDQTAALLFVDPSHESYNQPTEAFEDLLVAGFGPATGAGREARQLVESLQYAATLAHLPNVPTIVLTSMKTAPSADAADRQKWYAAHEELGAGLSNFSHIQTTRAGHYLQREAPELVLSCVEKLLNV